MYICMYVRMCISCVNLSFIQNMSFYFVIYRNSDISGYDGENY